MHTNMSWQRDNIALDASGRALGRLASEAARYLQGKHHPTWSPNLDHGALVTVKNLHQARFTGGKLKQKLYYRHTNYPGNMRIMTLKESWQKNPQVVLRNMVAKMLPKNKLRKAMLKRLKFG